MIDKCLRQDPNNLKIGDIFEITCTACGMNIEFFKNDAQRKCKSCGQAVANPKCNPDAT